MDIEAVLDHLESHFPLASRLLPDTDAEDFLQDLERAVEQHRQERIQRVPRDGASGDETAGK